MRWRTNVRRSLNAVFRLALRRPTPGRILLYHRVTTDGDPTESVAPATFSDHLRALDEADLTGASIADCLEHGFPARLLALSFDDGHDSLKWPCDEILARGWSASLFVVPDWIDRGVANVLSWSDLRAFADAGIEIGVHGLRHEFLTASEPLVRILTEARQRVESGLGRQVSGLAYPFGIAPRAARQAAKTVGFAYAATTCPRANTVSDDRFRLGRNEVHGTDRPHQLLGKLAGTDDWMAPMRDLENRLRHGA